MQTPLYSKILAINEKARFHMPGHSGKDFYEFKANKLDITEIEELDNLLTSSSVIKEAEDLIAKAYGYKHALMATSGSTVCMQIVLYALKELGYSIIAIGEMHSSFYNACRIFSIDYKEYKTKEDLLPKVDTRSAIFITSPNYFGKTKCLDRYKEYADLLVVDAAHGAHFAFSSILPEYPKADIVFSSMHKTMPAQTGAAIINVNSDELYDNLKFARSLIHSTSPNYMTMASMDLARAYMEENSETLYKHIKEVVDIKKGKFAGYTIEKSDDISRLVINTGEYDAEGIAKDLHKLGFDVEMALENKLVFILTPFNIDALDELESAITSIEAKPLKAIKGFNMGKRLVSSLDNLTPAFLEIDDAEGYISNATICIYPPSIPVLNRGDKITKEDINILNQNKGRLLGLVNGKVPVLK